MNLSKIQSFLKSFQKPIHSRIAPTPSGFLHKGNAFSFLLTWILVRKTEGTLTLRIDDIDKSRKRTEYLQDIFDTLHFLEMDWDKGAKDSQDFEKNYSQHHFLEMYQNEIEVLKTKNAVFECDCSRSVVQARHAESKNVYDGFCFNNSDKKITKKTALRINTDISIAKSVQIDDILNESLTVNIHKKMPYFIAQKKDKLPSYQLVSLIDDCRMNINVVVRGSDLIHSTAAQLFLANILEKKLFLETTFLHHNLIEDTEGNKISKSAGNKYDSFSVKYFRENGGTKEIFLRQFCEWLGIESKKSLEAILDSL
ncbi:glutamate--tRNA ligase family protein [Bernardetia sp.]|uniref:glutamate--tRNA ligase family protein n=1 Tax=Bernardetia sp. TaxID=1937974 RepID=UPI0025BC3BBB|nr:glutamate--tRNA ligase family protein [Bernardetia sp.]